MKWGLNMSNVFKDVMLNRVAFIDLKNDLKFEFYDSSTGNNLGEVICKNIFSFSYHTTFEPNEETFPCFVLDVSASKLKSEDDVSQAFKKLNFRYSYSDGLAIPKSDEYNLFSIQGGPIDLTVLCKSVDVMKL